MGYRTDFGAEFIVFFGSGFDLLTVVIEEGGHDGDGADEDTEKAEAFGAEEEVIDLEEEDGERFEPKVEKAVDEGRVEDEEEADG